jgi:hypothetical protein
VVFALSVTFVIVVVTMSGVGFVVCIAASVVVAGVGLVSSVVR